ncbi:MAG TPA: aldehyde dehydrogenase family protein [Casimicrobiaceae bacterium]|nr:aldehyde dehydrogenase family protein [Casimicrobiaceae bacterium]
MTQISERRYEQDLRDIPRRIVIGGEKVAAASGRTFATLDPATGRAIAEVPRGDAEDVDRAISAARTALRSEWRSVLPAERGRILQRTAALIRRDAARLARIETLDCGKPLRESKGDIETAARYFEYYAGIADKMQGDTIPLGPDYVSFTLHEPIGVTAHIIPWNFPLVTTARGIAPALACGCTAVVKPAEQTPITALMLADILREAGLPNGVYNVVTGYGEEAGAALVRHANVSHVTFTGSVETGKLVMKSAADHIASVTLELGGKSPVVVLADADIDAAVQGTLKAIYMNAGQVCSAGSRLVVERRVHDVMRSKLAQAASGLALGHGLDDADLGPLVSAEQLDRVAGYVADAKRRGLEVVVGGAPATVSGLEGGWFYPATILEGAKASDPVVQEEIFGPVLTVQVADDAEEALALANGTAYGLVAGIYTRDITRALRLARDVEAGQVFINQFFAGGVETPFGGVKQSGFGREKGLDALKSYYRVKCVTARI